MTAKPDTPDRIVLIAVSALIIALAAQPEVLNAALQWQRDALEFGEWYRWLTGHWVHLGWAHALMNLFVLVLLVSLLQPKLTTLLRLVEIVLLSLGVSAGLHWFSPDLSWYVGLSGVLHGLFVCWSLSCHWLTPLLKAGTMVGIAVKLSYEQVTGDAAGSQMIGGSVIVDAHLYGAITGLLVAGGMAVWQRTQASKPQE